MRFVEEEQIQTIFEIPTHAFDCKKLDELLAACRKSTLDGQWNTLMAFIWNYLLRIDPTERLGPTEAWSAFKEVKAKLEGRANTLPHPQSRKIKLSYKL